MAKMLLILCLVTKFKLYVGLVFLYILKLVYERVKNLICMTWEMREQGLKHLSNMDGG